MTESEPEGIRLRSRTLGCIHPDDDTAIVVEHVYAPEGTETCPDCGGASHDPGMVGMIVSREGEDGEPRPVPVLMAPEDALMLANRLTRGAQLVLESAEEIPDIEREAARFAAAEGTGDA